MSFLMKNMFICQYLALPMCRGCMFFNLSRMPLCSFEGLLPTLIIRVEEQVPTLVSK